MTEDEIREMLRKCREAPAGQIDPQYSERLGKLAAAEPLSSDDILAILDDIVYHSGASDFCVRLIDIIWTEKCKLEGLTPEQANIQAQARRDEDARRR